MPIDPGTLLALIQARRQQQTEQDTTAAPAVIGRGLGNVADLLGTFGRNTVAVDARAAEQANLITTAQGERLKQVLEVAKAAKDAGLTVTPESLRGAIQPPAATAPVPYTGAERLFGAARPLVKPAGADVSRLQFGAKPVKDNGLLITQDMVDKLNERDPGRGDALVVGQRIPAGAFASLVRELPDVKPTGTVEKSKITEEAVANTILSGGLAFDKNSNPIPGKNVNSIQRAAQLAADHGFLKSPKVRAAIEERNRSATPLADTPEEGGGWFGLKKGEQFPQGKDLYKTLGIQTGQAGASAPQPGKVAALRPGQLSRSQFPPGTTDAQAIESARQRGIALTVLP